MDEIRDLELPLELESIIGFGGSVHNGLIRHPDGEHVIYPLGSTVVIRNKKKPQEQSFLMGHTNTITCLAVSKSGRFICGGQVTHMGFQADIIVWDFASRTLRNRFTLHKGKIQAVAFSPNEKYLASVGGQDDNSVIVWDLAQNIAVCGSPASQDSAGVALCLAFLNNSDDHFITGGHATLRVWEINGIQRKVKPVDCQLGQIKRVVTCIHVDSEDENMYCGSTTGDILRINIKTKLFKHSGPPKEKDLFSMGVISLAITPDKQNLLVGCGDGTVALLRLSNLSIVKKANLLGQVTSIAFDDASHFYAGTSMSNIYFVDLPSLTPTLLSTCHYAVVNDICFPKGSSDVFATSSDKDVRIWNASTGEELLRIAVPNLECKCITFNSAGSSLVSGWTDGKIRSFGPQSGRLQYVVNDAHKRGVTALAITDPFNAREDYRIISGGEDGQVRIWKVTRQTQVLENAMKEHKGVVTCIKLRKNNYECVSSSSDGSCIIWDLVRYVRNQVMFAPSFFKAVCYYPEENQVLTTGTDRKIAYWEAYDGSLIRNLDVPTADSINGLDITENGEFFVIGGSNKVIKIFRYQEGNLLFLGTGHSTEILKVRISPDQKHIVSVSADGAIFKWKFPWDKVPFSNNNQGSQEQQSSQLNS